MQQPGRFRSVIRAGAALAKAAVSPITSLFGNGPLPRARTPGGWLRESFAGAWQRGVTVEPVGAVVCFGAVFACITRISADIGKLQPVLLYKQPNGIKAPAFDTYPQWTVLRKPNNFQTWQQFVAYWLLCKLIHGNAYVLKVRGADRSVTRLYVLDPRRVTPMVTAEGDVYYSLGGDDLSQIPAGQVVPASEIMHDRYATLWHPLIGVSPITANAASATHGMRIQSNSATFFENMSRPSGMLTAPGVIDDVTAERLKREWDANFAGQNIGKLAVLGDGLKYEPMTIPAHDAQLIEQLAWTVEDVARTFGVPLYKINAGPMPTAGNVEALQTQYYQGCLQEQIEAIENLLAAGMDLPLQLSIELDLDGLLRMDALSHIEMLTKAVSGAIMKPNEARLRRNLEPVEGGDQVYLQQQNYSLAALAKRDAREDPFAAGGGSKPPAPPAPPVVAVAAEPEDAAKAAKSAQAAAEAAREAVSELLRRMERDAIERAEQAEAVQVAQAEAARAEAAAAAESVLEHVRRLESRLEAAAQARDVPVALEASPDTAAAEFMAAVVKAFADEPADAWA